MSDRCLYRSLGIVRHSTQVRSIQLQRYCIDRTRFHCLDFWSLYEFQCEINVFLYLGIRYYGHESDCLSAGGSHFDRNSIGCSYLLLAYDYLGWVGGVISVDSRGVCYAVFQEVESHSKGARFAVGAGSEIEIFAGSAYHGYVFAYFALDRKSVV